MDPFRGVLGVDLEGASACDIKNGAWAYSLHPSTIVYCAGFIYAETADGPRERVQWEPGEELDRRVVDFIAAGGTLLAHNAAFEKSMWCNLLTPVYDFPAVDRAQWSDTQARGLAVNLPLSLEGLTNALGCPTRKDLEGAALMKEMAVAVPDDCGGWTYVRDRAKVERLKVYNLVDVDATLDAHFALPRLSSVEHRIWLCSEGINERGVYLDQAFSAKAALLAAARGRELSNSAWMATMGEVHASKDTAHVKAWLKSRGVVLPKVRKKRKKTGEWYVTETLDKNALPTILERHDLPDDVRSVLELRKEANKVTSLAKLKRVPNMVAADGRLRYALTFCGAHTGRWTSQGLQLHNLPKDKIGATAGLKSNPAVRALSECVLQTIDEQTLPALQFLVDRPLDAISQSLRAMVAAPPGFDLIGGDYSAIEARIVAWLAGQDDVLDAFRAYDAGTGADVYVLAARNVESNDRQLGKVCTLALGFGMGEIKLITTARGYGVTIKPKEAVRIKRLWRGANGAIVSLWRDLEEACFDAILNPGRAIPCGRLVCAVLRGCLLIRLPSGRSLRYWKPKIVTVEKSFKSLDDDGNVVEKTVESDEIQFWTLADDKTSMRRESTYGGKLVENATQAVARELLGGALLRFEAAEDVLPYRTVIHVHDAIAAEVPAGAGDVGEFCTVMAETPDWAAGCPVKVDGYRSQRFKG